MPAGFIGFLSHGIKRLPKQVAPQPPLLNSTLALK